MPEAAWNIALAWHRDSDRVPLVRRFVDTVPAASVLPKRGVRRHR
jgi:hypothetical protein